MFSLVRHLAQLQCYAQHVLANGSEAFPHNGTALSSDGTRFRVSPSVAYDATTGSTFAFWVEENTLQSQFGLYAQKLDGTGIRQWGAEGVGLIPLGSSEISMVNTCTTGAGAFVFWSSAASFGQDVLSGMRLTASGSPDLGTIAVSSTTSDKLRLFLAKSTRGVAFLAWTDARIDEGDILVQNVNPDGTLGPDQLAAPGEGPPLAIRLSRPHPNPSRGDVRIDFALPGHGDFSLVLLDPQGRVVRRLAKGSGPRSGTAAWDGRDDAGTAVAPGIYFARLRSAAGVRIERVAVAR